VRVADALRTVSFAAGFVDRVLRLPLDIHDIRTRVKSLESERWLCSFEMKRAVAELCPARSTPTGKDILPGGENDHVHGIINYLNAGFLDQVLMKAISSTYLLGYVYLICLSSKEKRLSIRKVTDHCKGQSVFPHDDNLL
jgi:hypothetical protein